MASHLIIDGHLDIAMNAIERNRDQTKSVPDLRTRERERFYADGSRAVADKGEAVNTVALPDMQAGHICIGVGTVAARIEHPTNDYRGYDGQSICYAAGRGQLAYYEHLAEEGVIRCIRSLEDLQDHLAEWEAARGDPATDRPPVGLVLAMEGADPILGPDHVTEWWDHGLRMVSLAHYGKSSYANGTGCEGGITDAAPPLLEAIEDAGIILDLTHLTDTAFWEALEHFDGPVCASHCNCRALVPGQRQLSDEQLTAIIERDGVIGVAMDTWMLQPGWEKGIYNEVTATLETVVDHIDHICSLAGDANHVAIGSDLDGGYGREQVPKDLDTIADLQRIPSMLEERGYDQGEIEGVMAGNWVKLFERNWA